MFFTLQGVNWWTGVVWIIVKFLSAVWTPTAPIHWSTGEQVMECYISPNVEMNDKTGKKTKTLRLTLGTDVVKNKILEGSNFAALHSDICVAVLRVNVDGSGPVSGRVYRSVLRGDGLHANQLTTRLPLNNHRPQIRSEDAIERWACRERERWRDAAVHRGSVDGCDGACL